MLSLFNAARSNPRTTLAGLASFFAFIGGLFGTMHTGQTWPLVAGVVCSKLADMIRDALAADAKEAA